jgi:hypothetical protein
VAVLERSPLLIAEIYREGIRTDGEGAEIIDFPFVLANNILPVLS